MREINLMYSYKYKHMHIKSLRNHCNSIWEGMHEFIRISKRKPTYLNTYEYVCKYVKSYVFLREDIFL